MRTKVEIDLKKECFRQERKIERTKQAINGNSLYFSDAKRKHYKLDVDDTGRFTTLATVAHGRFMYVRTLDGLIIVTQDESHHHSYLANGKKVSSAGYFTFENGKLLSVSNESGHYTPTNNEMFANLKVYFELAKNPELIYEDHSSVLISSEIYQYKVKNILQNVDDSTQGIKMENLSPEATLVDQNSDYGKKVNILDKKTVNERYSSFYENKTNYTFFSADLSDNSMSNNQAIIHYQDDENILQDRGYNQDDEFFIM